MDDEKAVRGLIVMVLKKAGFAVLEACDGVEGLRVFRNDPDAIRLVLADLTMPRMGGLELAKAI